MVLRRQYRQLREELAKLEPPEGLEDIDYPFNAGMTPTTPTMQPESGGSSSNTPSDFTSSMEKDSTIENQQQLDVVELELQEDEVDEVIVKADIEEVAGSSSNDKGTSILDDVPDDSTDLSPEEIVLSMVW